MFSGSHHFPPPQKKRFHFYISHHWFLSLLVQFHQHITLPVSTYFFVLFSAKCPLLWVISFAFLHFLPSHYILYSQTLGFYHHHFTESIKIKVTNELHVANNFSFLILPDLSSAFNRVHLIWLFNPTHGFHHPKTISFFLPTCHCWFLLLYLE